jgi:hypothetical protein
MSIVVVATGGVVVPDSPPSPPPPPLDHCFVAALMMVAVGVMSALAYGKSVLYFF